MKTLSKNITKFHQNILKPKKESRFLIQDSDDDEDNDKNDDEDGVFSATTCGSVERWESILKKRLQAFMHMLARFP